MRALYAGCDLHGNSNFGGIVLDLPFLHKFRFREWNPFPILSLRGRFDRGNLISYEVVIPAPY